MAPHDDGLGDIGREAFDLVDTFYGGRTSVRAPKKRSNVPQQHAPVTSDEKTIDCMKAAKIYGGLVFTDYNKKRFVGRRP